MCTNTSFPMISTSLLIPIITTYYMESTRYKKEAVLLDQNKLSVNTGISAVLEITASN